MVDAPSIDEVRSGFEKQISELKKQIADINKSVGSRVRDYASDTLDSTSNESEGAIRHVGRQARAVAGAIKENPGTAATVLSSAGVVGFLLGAVVGHILAQDSWRWR